MLAIVFAPAFDCREDEPVRTSVTLRVQRLSVSALPSRPRKRSMIRRTRKNFVSLYSSSDAPGRRAPGVAAQVLLEIAQVGILARRRFLGNVAVRVVVDRAQRSIDRVDTLADGLAFALELGLEAGDLADRVLVQQCLEAHLEMLQGVACSTCSIRWNSADASMFTSTMSRLSARICSLWGTRGWPGRALRPPSPGHCA
jgi:hypothetical protein